MKIFPAVQELNLMDSRYPLFNINPLAPEFPFKF